MKVTKEMLAQFCRLKVGDKIQTPKDGNKLVTFVVVDVVQEEKEEFPFWVVEQDDNPSVRCWLFYDKENEKIRTITRRFDS